MKEFKFALKHTFPIFVAYIFLGIAFGILMINSGYGTTISLLSSIFIYAGSMQFVMIPLMISHTSILTLAVMAFFVNARHLFYGLGFIEKFRKMKWAYPYMVFSLTDETYSILCSVKYDEGINEQKAAFLISLLNQCYWVSGCVLGSIIGNYLDVDLTGIDFSATAFFLIVVVNQWKEYKTKLPFAIGAVCAVTFLFITGPNNFLIPTLSTSTILLIILNKHISLSDKILLKETPKETSGETQNEQ